MSVRLTEEQEARLSDLARNRDISADAMAQEIFDRYLEAQAEHKQIIARSRSQIAEGKTLAHNEVFTQLKQRMGW